MLKNVRKVHGFYWRNDVTVISFWIIDSPYDDLSANKRWVILPNMSLGHFFELPICDMEEEGTVGLRDSCGI